MTKLYGDGATVVAVVVTYRPDSKRLKRLLASTLSQVAAVVIVDNGDSVGLGGITWDKCLQCLSMHSNVGIAAAQNAGIRQAAALGASHILFLDHDSVPAPAMVSRLLEAHIALRERGTPVAAVGAAYTDGRHTSSSPFVVLGATGFRRIADDASNEPVATSFLISAGSLVSMEAIDAVGSMDERLFIDYVDVEWCMRAASSGWCFFGVPTARFEHELGSAPLAWPRNGKPVQVFGRTLPSRSPLRHYYLFRNGCWLILRSALPVRWKLLETKRLIGCFGAYVAFATERGSHLREMLRGVFHGMCGRLGPA